MYNWKRFWCRRDGLINLDDNGFLYNPESEYSIYHSTDVVPFSNLEKYPCLVLLGSAGVGKTTVLQHEFKSQPKNNIETDQYLHFNLNEYGNESVLRHAIFKSDEYTNWLRGDYRLHLFLDSVDECQLEINKLPTIISNQIKLLGEDSKRLKLWIAGRPGNWSELLIENFNDIWEMKNVGVFELAPLRKKDVAIAAESNGINSDNFINDIIEKELQPLAIYPITLNFLIPEYNKNQRFPESKYELYTKGCEQLCTEKNPDRHAAYSKALLSPIKRMSLAARIAAIMIFSNKSTISVKTKKTNTPDSILYLSDIQEGTEIATNNKYQFMENDLVETITQTTLFSSRGPNLFGFAHWTYAEFLAAYYLKLHKMPLEKIKSLVFTYDDIDMMLVPQLRETVAWLSTQSSELSKLTIQNDPIALLTGDVQSLSEGQRYDLVESLLDKFEKGKITGPDWGIYWLYKKLNHPKIADQLVRYIDDKSKNGYIRRIAIDIAEVCNIKKLQKLLVDISLDKSEDVYIRYQATYAIYKIGDLKTKKRLKNIILNPKPEDNDDELKGAALFALWPDIISTESAFDNITDPQRDSYYGVYDRFLSHLVNNLKIDDLPVALNWVKKHSTTGNRKNFRFERITDKILIKAQSNLENKKVVNAFASAIIPRLENYLTIFPNRSSFDDKKEIPLLSDTIRRNLITTLVNKIRQYRPRFLHIHPHNQRLLYDHDMEWLVRQLSSEPKNSKIESWAQIILDFYNISIPSHTNLVLKARDSCVLLAEKFEDFFKPVEINSSRAKKLKERYEEDIRWEKEQEERREKRKKQIKNINVLKLIKDSLKRFEGGDLNAWWVMVCKQITISIENDRAVSKDFVDITQSPGWALCDNSVKKRILIAAKKYIINARCKPEEWVGHYDLYCPDMAGYIALVLVKNQDPTFIESLKPKVWRNWAPIIIGYPEHYIKVEEGNIHCDLIIISYKHAKTIILKTLLAIIDHENRRNERLSIIRKLPTVLNNSMKNELLQIAKKRKMKESSFQDLITLLMKANYFPSIKYAKSLLDNYNFKGRPRVIVAAITLIAFSNNAGWPNIKRIIKKDNKLGKKIFLKLQSLLRFNKIIEIPTRIGENETANLYIWLLNHFPREKDPSKEDAHFVGSREEVAGFREGLLRSLADWGTIESVNAVKKIQQQFPDQDYLKYYLITARENLRKHGWVPLSPHNFLSLIEQPTSRIIQNSHDLMSVIIECLTRIEKKLQGQNSLARLLWDTKSFWPKSENDLSDYIKSELKDELEQSGIIALREVETRPPKKSEGGKSGEKIDIYVATFISAINQYINVFIEVKGCWNSKIKTSMEDQLLNRYLNESGCNCGIYLVGWYLCDQWDDEDKRKKKTFTPDIERAKEFLKSQANELSLNGKTILPYVLNCTLR